MRYNILRGSKLASEPFHWTSHFLLSTICIINIYLRHEGQVRELHMVRIEERKEKGQQLTGPKPATSRSVANSLAAGLRLLPAI